MNWPPEAVESLCTANGEKPLWPDRLSSSTVSVPPEEPELLLEEDELELLEDDDEELEELELELLDDEVEPPLSVGGVPL
jgi:hypothetical protein